MAGQEHCGPGVGQLPGQLLELVLQQRVQAAGRLVQDEQLGAVDDRLDDADLAPVAGAQLPDPPARVEVEAAQQLGDPAGVDTAAQLAVEVDQVLGGPAGVDRQLGWQVADPAPHRRVGAGAAEDLDLAAGRPDEVKQQPDGGGLAGPVRPQVAEHLALLDLEVELAQGLHRPKALGQADRADYRLAHRPLGSGSRTAPGARIVSTRRISSTGSGKIRVEFRSADTSAMVDSTRSCIAAGMRLQHHRGLAESGGRLLLAESVDDLGPPLAFGLGLGGHGPAHRLGQLDVLDLDQGDLDAPGVGELVDDLLEPLVDLVALDQQLVQVDLAEDAAQGGLGDLGGARRRSPRWRSPSGRGRPR